MHASNALARTEDAAWASVDEAKAALDTAGKDASRRLARNPRHAKEDGRESGGRHPGPPDGPQTSR